MTLRGQRHEHSMLIFCHNHRNQILVLHAWFQHVSWYCSYGSLCIRTSHSDTISCCEYFEYESPIWLSEFLHSCNGYIWRAFLDYVFSCACTFRFPSWVVKSVSQKNEVKMSMQFNNNMIKNYFTIFDSFYTLSLYPRPPLGPKPPEIPPQILPKKHPSFIKEEIKLWNLALWTDPSKGGL